MPTLAAEQLRQISTRLFQAAGVPDTIAARVSDSLVEANLAGHDSHGVLRVPQYLEYLREGEIDPHAEIELLAETPTTALLDAHWAFGQLAAAEGMRLAIDKALENNLGMVAVRRSAHIGRLGEYSLMAADEGLVGAVLCNSSMLAAPYGGMARVLSTNPMSVAVPAGDRSVFLLDFATTVRAEGKVRLAKEKGEHVPEGWILDKDGQPTTEPEDLYDDGMLLPLGEYKGYALSLLVDILGGVLTGHGATSSEVYSHGNGVAMMAIDIEPFCSRERFEHEVENLLDRMKAVPPAPGFSEVLVPGEPEARSKAVRLREGILVPEKVWQAILDEGERLGVRIEGSLDA